MDPSMLNTAIYGRFAIDRIVIPLRTFVWIEYRRHCVVCLRLLAEAMLTCGWGVFLLSPASTFLTWLFCWPK